MLAVTVPEPDSVKGPTDPRIVVLSLASAVKETAPVGVPDDDVTVIPILKFCPDVTDVALGVPRVVVVAVRPAVPDRVNRFATLIDPSPVARS